MTYEDKQKNVHKIVHINRIHPDGFFECLTNKGQIFRLYRSDINLMLGEVLPMKFPPNLFLDIKEFHIKREQTYDGPPRDLDVDFAIQRISRKLEELAEISKAYCQKNRAEILDGLVDLVYYSIGNAYLHGFNFDEAWRRVHDANMKKNKINADGRATKPEGWMPPDLKDLVQ